jgi:hypothetical protein
MSHGSDLAGCQVKVGKVGKSQTCRVQLANRYCRENNVKVDGTIGLCEHISSSLCSRVRPTDPDVPVYAEVWSDLVRTLGLPRKVMNLKIVHLMF